MPAEPPDICCIALLAASSALMVDGMAVGPEWLFGNEDNIKSD